MKISTLEEPLNENKCIRRRFVMKLAHKKKGAMKISALEEGAQ
jgi:hypothetical protein